MTRVDDEATVSDRNQRRLADLIIQQRAELLNNFKGGVEYAKPKLSRDERARPLYADRSANIVIGGQRDDWR